MMLMSNLDKKKFIKKSFVVLLLILLLILALELNSTKKDLEVAKNNGSQINELLQGGNRAPGMTCGILTQQKAEKLLGVKLDRSFAQGPDNLVTENTPNNRVIWKDSCRYVDPDNSSKYIELFIYSYQNSLEAKNSFNNILPTVNDNLELNPENIGERLVYDNGVYYLLKDSRIIQVAANNDSATNLENFSRTIFDYLTGELGL